MLRRGANLIAKALSSARWEYHDRTAAVNKPRNDSGWKLLSIAIVDEFTLIVHFGKHHCGNLGS